MTARTVGDGMFLFLRSPPSRSRLTRLLGGLPAVPWAKFSDTFALHSRITGLLRVRGADARTTNEVSGFITRCAANSAAQMEDYYFDVAIARAMDPDRWEVLIRQAREAGLIVSVKGRGNSRRWKLVELPNELFHIRYRDDVLWDRQRDRDRSNPELIMPVLLRDGDGCRYCGLVITWADRKSGRGGTLDHRVPGQPATVDTFVVSCRTCNSKRKDNPQADVDVPLRPAPAVPYFSPSSKTLERLMGFYGPERLASMRPGTQPATAPRPGPDTAPRPASQADTANDARPGPDTARPVHRDTARPPGTATPLRRDTARPACATPADEPITGLSLDPEGGCRDGPGLGSGRVRDGTGSPPDPPGRRVRKSRGRRGGDPDA